MIIPLFSHVLSAPQLSADVAPLYAVVRRPVTLRGFVDFIRGNGGLPLLTIIMLFSFHRK